MIYLCLFLYLSVDNKGQCCRKERKRINSTACYWNCIGNLGRQNAIMHLECSQDIWVNTCTPVKSAMGYLMTVSCQNSVLHLIWKTAPPAAWCPFTPCWSSASVWTQREWVVSPESPLPFLAAAELSWKLCIKTLIKPSFFS